jgi:hypothetical protein
MNRTYSSKENPPPDTKLKKLLVAPSGGKLAEREKSQVFDTTSAYPMTVCFSGPLHNFPPLELPAPVNGAPQHRQNFGTSCPIPTMTTTTQPSHDFFMPGGTPPFRQVSFFHGKTSKTPLTSPVLNGAKRFQNQYGTRI